MMSYCSQDDRSWSSLEPPKTRMESSLAMTAGIRRGLFNGESGVKRPSDKLMHSNGETWFSASESWTIYALSAKKIKKNIILFYKHLFNIPLIIEIFNHVFPGTRNRMSFPFSICGKVDNMKLLNSFLRPKNRIFSLTLKKKNKKSEK